MDVLGGERVRGGVPMRGAHVCVCVCVCACACVCVHACMYVCESVCVTECDCPQVCVCAHAPCLPPGLAC